MDLRVLGPVTVDAGDGPIDLGPRKRRYLLALLALEVNRVLHVERLVDLMWPDEPPRTAVHAVRVSASSLRVALRAVAGSLTVDASGGGYVLRADPMVIDAHRFRRLLAQAAPETDGRARLALLDRALGLWRGPALAGVVPQAVRGQLCHGLEDARLTCVEDRADTLLRLGGHGELLDELTAHVATHPLRERPVGQLMLALYRAGRVPDALGAYTAARARVADQLGLDPGSDLDRLHQQILRRDPQLDLGAVPPLPPAPAQLPPAVAGFVGREAYVARLDRLLAEPAVGGQPTAGAFGGAAGAAGAPASVLIATIGGTAGVGKTALAVHWAHRVAHRFPDGQLYANLRGFDADGLPAQPSDVVRDFLQALRVTPQQLPDGAPAQADLLRSLLSGRRLLMLLDNAASAEQVRPLLPGAPGCLVVVTSRNQLTSLVAVEGAHPVPLDLLTHGQARQLLANRMGRARVAAHPAAVDSLIAACARLPLALAVVSARAATNPQLELPALADELVRERDGLDAFDGGDAPADVRAVLSWSYRAVSAPARRMFRLLGTHPGPAVSVAVAASTAGLPSGQARRLLRELTAAALLSELVPGRYAGHDLLRAYAAELASGDPEREDARRRMLDHYLHSADRAAGLLDSFRDPLPVGEPAPGVIVDQPADDGAALSWFAVEYPVLLAAVDSAANGGADVHAWQLAGTLTEVFERLGRWEDWSAVHSAGLSAARRLGDLRAQAYCLIGLGRAAMWLRSWTDAHARFGQALALFMELSDRDGQARTQHNIGYLHEHHGADYRQALLHSERALALFRECGDPAGIARALNAVGWYKSLLDRPDEAVGHCEEALALLRQLGDQRSEALTWDSLAHAYQGRGEHDRAISCFHQAIEMMSRLGDSFHEADAAEHLGDAYQLVGDRAAAAVAWRRSLRRLETLGHPRAQALQAKLDLS